MDDEKKQILSTKRKHLALQLQAREFVARKIAYHWLDILTLLNRAGIRYNIEYLCHISLESYPYYVKAIEELNHPELNSSLIKTEDKHMMDVIFTKYPSVSTLKYDINLPKLPGKADDIEKILRQADRLIGFGTEPVYFLSPDWSPVIQLNWKEILKNGQDVFDEVPLCIIITNKNLNKILFKSIEDEWRFLAG